MNLHVDFRPIRLYNHGMSKMSSARISSNLLEMLVCPITKGPLEYDEARQELVSHKAKRAFPVREGIPVLLAEEAREIT